MFSVAVLAADTVDDGDSEELTGENNVREVFDGDPGVGEDDLTSPVRKNLSEIEEKKEPGLLTVRCRGHEGQIDAGQSFTESAMCGRAKSVTLV